MSRLSLLGAQHGPTYGSDDKKHKTVFETLPFFELLRICSYLAENTNESNNVVEWLTRLWRDESAEKAITDAETPKKIPDDLLNLLLTSKKIFALFIDLPEKSIDHFFSTLYRFNKQNGAVGYRTLTAFSSFVVNTPTKIKTLPELIEMLRDPDFIDKIPVDFRMMHAFKRRLYIAIFMVCATAVLLSGVVKILNIQGSEIGCLFTDCTQTILDQLNQPNIHSHWLAKLNPDCAVKGDCAHLQAFINTTGFGWLVANSILLATFCNHTLAALSEGVPTIQSLGNKTVVGIESRYSCSSNSFSILYCVYMVFAGFAATTMYALWRASQSFFNRSKLPSLNSDYNETLESLPKEKRKLLLPLGTRFFSTAENNACACAVNVNAEDHKPSAVAEL